MPLDSNTGRPAHMSQEEIDRLSSVTGINLSKFIKNSNGVPVLPRETMKKELIEIGSIYDIEMEHYNKLTGQTERVQRPCLVVGKTNDKDQDVTVLQITSSTFNSPERAPYRIDMDPQRHPGLRLYKNRSYLDASKRITVSVRNLRLPRWGSLSEKYPAVMQNIMLRMEQSLLNQPVTPENHPDASLVREEILLLTKRIDALKKILDPIEKKEKEIKKALSNSNQKNKYASLKKDTGINNPGR